MRASILAVIGIIPTLAAAQTAPDTATRLRKEYDLCVYAAVGTQWTQNLKLDPNVAAESAFQACTTEEQGMRALLMAINVSYPQIETTIVGIKLNLKRTIREIMADPAGYKRKHAN